MSIHNMNSYTFYACTGHYETGKGVRLEATKSTKDKTNGTTTTTTAAAEVAKKKQQSILF